MDATTWNYNGWFGVPRDITLTTGVFDEDARDVFCRGHCHSLALALEEMIPGAVLHGLWDYGEIVHVFIALPCGDYLDGNGLVDEDFLLRAASDEGFIEMLDIADIDWLEITGEYRERRVEDARPFARALIERERLGLLTAAR